MKITLTFLLVITSLSLSMAHAEIYKKVDANGRITYSNLGAPNAVPLKIGTKPIPKPVKKAAAPQKSPKKKVSKTKRSTHATVSKRTQSKRDETRKKILIDEYKAEKEALLAAQQAYKDGLANPEVYRKKNANGTVSTFRNLPKFNKKITKLKDDLQSHERNIELLQKEIYALQ
jgi:hypothetical protein